MEDVIIGILIEACWEKNVPAGSVWEIRLKFLAWCGKNYPHLNYYIDNSIWGRRNYLLNYLPNVKAFN